MPPAGCSSDISPAQTFSNVEPRSISAEDNADHRRQLEFYRQFHETLNAIRVMADGLAERFRQVSEQTARIRREHNKIRREMRKQQRSWKKNSRLLEKEKIARKQRILKSFFSQRERRDAFPEEAKKYFASIR